MLLKNYFKRERPEAVREKSSLTEKVRDFRPGLILVAANNI